MTWAQIGELALEITKAAKQPGFFGMYDGGRYEPALEVWLRQRGKALYTDDGKLGFDATDIGEWFAFWHDLRKRGALRLGRRSQALDMGEIDTSLLTLGKAAMVFAHSNQLVGFQAVIKSKLGMTMYPSGGPGAKPGQYLKPSMLLEHLRARRRSPEAAVKLVDFYVANNEAGLLLGRRARRAGLERGAQGGRADARRARQARWPPTSAFVSDKVGAAAGAAAAGRRRNPDACCAGSTSRSASAGCRSPKAPSSSWPRPPPSWPAADAMAHRDATLAAGTADRAVARAGLGSRDATGPAICFCCPG